MYVYLMNAYLKRVKYISEAEYIRFETSTRYITEFEIRINDVKEYLFLLNTEDDFFVFFDNDIDSDFGIIERCVYKKDENNNDILTIYGSMSKVIFDNSIVHKVVNMKKISPIYYVYYVIHTYLKLKNMYINRDVGSEYEFPDYYKISTSYGTVYDNIIDTLEQFNLCLFFRYSIVADRDYTGYVYSEDEELPKTNVAFREITITTGTDRTIGNTFGNKPVILSYNYGSIVTPEYIKVNAKNCIRVLIAGEGEAKQRKTTEYENTFINSSVTQWNAKELYVDARDIQKESDDTDEQYNDYLTQRGQEKEYELKETVEYNFDYNNVSGCEYGTDFFMGDKITLYDEHLDLLKDCYILGAEHTFFEGVWTTNIVLSVGVIKKVDVVKDIKSTKEFVKVLKVE